MARLEHSGNAGDTTLAGDITAGSTSISLVDATGWPTGAVAPFVITVDRGGPSEEKILVQSRTGNVLTVSTRGYDGTTAVSHTTGQTAEHTIAAVELDESNAHVNDDSRDDHSQYLNTARHDTTARHTIGSVIAAGSPTTIAAGAVASAGAANSVARSDHVHGFPEGLKIFPAGIVFDCATASAPAGSLFAFGQAVSRTTYAALFAAIGTTYGSGDGSTTFNLPDYRGRTGVGLDNMGGSDAGRLSSANTLGLGVGAETHTLTIPEIPSHGHLQNSHNHTQNSHNHTVNDPGHNHSYSHHAHTGSAAAGGAPYFAFADTATNTTSNDSNISLSSATATNQSTTATNQNTGGGGAHNNMQPSILVNKVITTGGV